MTKISKELSTEAVDKLLKNELDIVIEPITEDEAKDIEQTYVEEPEKTEPVVNDINITKVDKNIDYIGRGFNSIKEAYAFVESATFAKLGKADQEEYKNWLKK